MIMARLLSDKNTTSLLTLEDILVKDIIYFLDFSRESRLMKKVGIQ